MGQPDFDLNEYLIHFIPEYDENLLAFALFLHYEKSFLPFDELENMAIQGENEILNETIGIELDTIKTRDSYTYSHNCMKGNWLVLNETQADEEHQDALNEELDSVLEDLPNQYHNFFDHDKCSQFIDEGRGHSLSCDDVEHEAGFFNGNDFYAYEQALSCDDVEHEAGFFKGNDFYAYEQALSCDDVEIKTINLKKQLELNV